MTLGCRVDNFSGCANLARTVDEEVVLFEASDPDAACDWLPSWRHGNNVDRAPRQATAVGKPRRVRPNCTVHFPHHLNTYDVRRP